jgi:hypothetical protein
MLSSNKSSPDSSSEGFSSRGLKISSISLVGLDEERPLALLTSASESLDWFEDLLG